MPLTLTFTNAGFARFTAAQLGNGADLRISAVGISDSAMIVAPTLTALPGEIRRFATVSGAQVGDNIVHLISSTRRTTRRRPTTPPAASGGLRVAADSHPSPPTSIHRA
jgi:hypothetical protein